MVINCGFTLGDSLNLQIRSQDHSLRFPWWLFWNEPDGLDNEAPQEVACFTEILERAVSTRKILDKAQCVCITTTMRMC